MKFVRRGAYRKSTGIWSFLNQDENVPWFAPHPNEKEPDIAFAKFTDINNIRNISDFVIGMHQTYQGLLGA
jgi:hypothetical protein